MKENLTLTRRTAVALSDCLMLFLGLYGTVFCLVTAFSLPVDYRTITMTCLVCAPLFTAVFALPWYWSRVALYLGCAAAVGITAWRWLDLLKLGNHKYIKQQRETPIIPNTIPAFPNLLLILCIDSVSYTHLSFPFSVL